VNRPQTWAAVGIGACLMAVLLGGCPQATTDGTTGDLADLQQQINQLAAEVDSQQGQPGVPGATGPEGPEGPQGLQGPTGAQGPAGNDGLNGDDGVDGENCWDTDGDGELDASEDRNLDGVGDAQDCLGEAGRPGDIGPRGLPGEGVMARGNVQADGTPTSASGTLISAVRTATGQYTLEIQAVPGVDINSLPVIVTVVQPSGAAPTPLTTLVVPIGLNLDVLTVDVYIFDLDGNAVDSAFNVVAFES
jgi:hypothetical protein